MPTLAGLLGYVDSVVTPAKRKLADLLQNPADYAQQHMGLLNDRTRDWNALNKMESDGRRLDQVGSVMGGLPQYKNAQREVMQGLLNVMPVGATVWHGSPHKFDKFDASKIGTGEGAQSYGHGLYLAESPQVANSYQKALAPEKRVNDLNSRMKLAQVGDKPLDSFGIDMSQDLIDAAKVGGKPFIDLATQKRARWAEMVNDQTYPFRDYAAEKLKAYDALLSEAQKSKVEYTGGGNLYKVDLPDEHIAKMLDWDKPLSQQSPEVQKLLEKSGLFQNGQWGLKGKTPVNPQNATGSDLFINYMQAMDASGKGDRNIAPQVSELLKNSGIQGIRYLDQGSRGAGQGTSNFVVFPGNEGILSILERNGIPLK